MAAALSGLAGMLRHRTVLNQVLAHVEVEVKLAGVFQYTCGNLRDIALTIMEA